MSRSYANYYKLKCLQVMQIALINQSCLVNFHLNKSARQKTNKDSHITETALNSPNKRFPEKYAYNVLSFSPVIKIIILLVKCQQIIPRTQEAKHSGNF